MESNEHIHRKILQLEEENKRYKALFNNAVEGILVAGIEDKRFLYANRTACEMFGYTNEEILNMGVMDIHPGEDVDYVISVFRDQAEGKLAVAADIPCVKKNGEVFYADIHTGRVVFDGIECNAGFFINVSERRKAETYNRSRDERIRKYHSAIMDILSLEPDGAADLNDAFERISKIAGETLGVGRSGIWILDEENENLHGACIYDNVTKEFSVGEVFSAEEYPEYFKSIIQHRAIDAGNAVADGRTSEFAETYFKEYGVDSVLDAAIMMHGRVMGVVSFEHRGEAREWTSDEITFAGEVADQVAKALVQSERMNALRCATDSEARYRNTINSMLDAIHVIDPDFEVVVCNDSMIRMNRELGFETDVLGKSIFDIYPFLPDRVRNEYRNVFDSGEMLRSEERNVFGEREFFTETRKIPVMQDGKVIQVITVIRDITEQKKAERELNLYKEHLEEMVMQRSNELEKAHEKLIAAERLAVLGKFSGSIAHEIRNPLGVISLSAQYLKQTLKDTGEKQQRHLDKILSQSERMSSIIESIMKLSRMESPSLHETPLADFVRQELERMEIPGRIEIIEEITAAPVVVEIDRGQMSLALTNIINNAVQSMKEGGRLTVSVTYADGNDSGNAVITISDTGCGIPGDSLGRVFEPLYTTKIYGIGFGLTIVKMVVERHGGSVRAESKQDRGTDIIIEIPCKK